MYFVSRGKNAAHYIGAKDSFAKRELMLANPENRKLHTELFMGQVTDRERSSHELGTNKTWDIALKKFQEQAEERVSLAYETVRSVSWKKGNIYIKGLPIKHAGLCLGVKGGVLVANTTSLSQELILAKHAKYSKFMIELYMKNQYREGAMVSGFYPKDSITLRGIVKLTDSDYGKATIVFLNNKTIDHTRPKVITADSRPTYATTTVLTLEDISGASLNKRYVPVLLGNNRYLSDSAYREAECKTRAALIWSTDPTLDVVGFPFE